MCMPSVYSLGVSGDKGKFEKEKRQKFCSLPCVDYLTSGIEDLGLFHYKFTNRSFINTQFFWGGHD